MNDLKSAVVTLLFCSVCGLILGFLLPEGGVSRTVKTLIGVVLLSALCAPIFGVFELFDDAVSDRTLFSSFGERDTSAPYDAVLEKTEQTARAFCNTIVTRHTNVPRKITVSAHISEDNVISIEHVRIVFEASPEGREAIKDEIAAEFGIIPEIRVEQEND